MAKTPFEMITRPGLRPEDRKYPGHGYRSIREAGMLIERDVAVPMRDGIKIYVDILRPDSGARVPAIICWSAYGKHRPAAYERFYKNGGVKDEWFSKYADYEGPDPLYWVPRGYALVHVDPRGVWHSEGNARYWGREEGEDGHDLVEWLGVRDWCNGKVGMAGVSYLAIVQWHVAATKPRHLAAINPWEGFSDMYREFAYHGGIPETFFLPVWYSGVCYGRNRVEDVVEMQKQHPLFDDYWATKVADWSKIDVPAFVVAAWGDQGLHTRGTIEAFKRISSKDKFLEVHGRKKWEYFYQPENVERQRLFFDRYLKGIDNEVKNWPRARLETREKYYVGKFRSASEWPIAGTKYRSLYLDGRARALKAAPLKSKCQVSYSAPGDQSRCPAAYDEHRLTFDYTFRETADVIGNMKLRLWVEAQGSDDMDIFVAVQKFDRAGKYVPFAGFSALEDGPVALGWLRVSHRELDAKRSTPEQPWLLHRRELKLKVGEIVPVDIEIWPSGTRFAAGERLRLVVQGSDIYKYAQWLRLAGHPETRNAGTHVIHTGGKYDSHLLMPVAPRR